MQGDSGNNKKYKLLGTLGKGSFGKVKEAEHCLSKEKIAIKILDKSRIKKEDDLIRIRREINILKRVHHKNIIQLYEIIETNKYFFFVMEYAQKGELSHHIEKQNKLEELEACKFFQQLISAIDYLHRIGCAHRDIKPSNILLTSKYDLKLIDFGLGNLYNDSEKLKTACGSPCYAAPEIISGELYNPITVDIWSSGITLFAMLCGFLPFDEDSKSVLYQKILACDYKIPSHVSPHARDLLTKILVRSTRRRLKISQILLHPWFNIYKPCQVSRGIILSDTPLPINNQVLVIAANQLGVTPEIVRQMVQDNDHNKYTTHYYLMVRKFKRGALDLAEHFVKPVKPQGLSEKRRHHSNEGKGGGSKKDRKDYHAAMAAASSVEKMLSGQQNRGKRMLTVKDKRQYQSKGKGGKQASSSDKHSQHQQRGSQSRRRRSERSSGRSRANYLNLKIKSKRVEDRPENRSISSKSKKSRNKKRRGVAKELPEIQAPGGLTVNDITYEIKEKITINTSKTPSSHNNALLQHYSKLYHSGRGYERGYSHSHHQAGERDGSGRGRPDYGSGEGNHHNASLSLERGQGGGPNTSIQISNRGGNLTITTKNGSLMLNGGSIPTKKNNNYRIKKGRLHEEDPRNNKTNQSGGKKAGGSASRGNNHNTNNKQYFQNPGNSSKRMSGSKSKKRQKRYMEPKYHHQGSAQRRTTSYRSDPKDQSSHRGSINLTSTQISQAGQNHFSSSNRETHKQKLLNKMLKRMTAKNQRSRDVYVGLGSNTPKHSSVPRSKLSRNERELIHSNSIQSEHGSLAHKHRTANSFFKPSLGKGSKKRALSFSFNQKKRKESGSKLQKYGFRSPGGGTRLGGLGGEASYIAQKKYKVGAGDPSKKPRAMNSKRRLGSGLMTSSLLRGSKQVKIRNVKLRQPIKMKSKRRK